MISTHEDARSMLDVAEFVRIHSMGDDVDDEATLVLVDRVRACAEAFAPESCTAYAAAVRGMIYELADAHDIAVYRGHGSYLVDLVDDRKDGYAALRIDANGHAALVEGDGEDRA